MPEGDTIFRAARTLHRVLAGHAVTRFESVFPSLTRVDVDRPLAGRTVESVAARGKHLLMAFSGDLVLHTHMRMNGSWHIYPRGERWKRPARDMRIVIATATAEAVAFNVPVAEFLTARDVERHAALRQLGPDLLAEAFDDRDALARIRSRPDDAIGDVLLNQRVIAGIGNVLKSETLFESAVDPFARVADLPDPVIERVLGRARALIAANAIEPGSMLTPSAGRRTTRSMNPAARLWVYGRDGKPCRHCGVPIRSRKTGEDARLTYWCPRCQT